MGGELYIALSSMRGIGFILDEIDLVLKITALPFYFSKKIINFKSPRPPNVDFPKDNSAFLNYAIDHKSDFGSTRTMDLNTELGIRYNDFLFLSAHTVTSTLNHKAEDEKTAARLMSNLTYDQRESNNRFIIGDFNALSGRFGSNLNLGGISYSKAYQITPYFITHPEIDLSGNVSLPSELTVFYDGVLIKRQDLPPGPFELQNFSPREGAGVLELLLKDPFGREKRILSSYYMTSELLKKGLHDYSYNFGFIREDFGIKNFKYRQPYLSAFHRYGINDTFTGGIHVESTPRRYNIGPSSSFRLQNAGVVEIALSHSRNNDREIGRASLLNYLYQGREFGFNYFVNYFSKHYTPIILESSSQTTRLQAGGGFSYSTAKTGTIRFGFDFLDRYVGTNRRVLSFIYSSTSFYKMTLFLTYRRIIDSENDNQFLFRLSYFPAHGIFYTAQHERTQDTYRESAQIEKNPPVGSGWGARASYERVDNNTDTNNTDTFLQYNARYGIYTGRYLSIGDEETFEASASGGIAYVANKVSLGRPLRDSFALVDVNGVKDVRVYFNSQEVGKTGPDGLAFIPDLNSYSENQISLSDRDLPMDYSISNVLKFVSPAFRSGSFIKFDATRFQAYFGTISIRIGNDKKPIEYLELSIIQDGDEITFPTGTNGEFYFENIKPGEYNVSTIYMDMPCSFDMMIPESEETLIDLGEFVCETAK